MTASRGFVLRNFPQAIPAFRCLLNPATGPTPTRQSISFHLHEDFVVNTNEAPNLIRDALLPFPVADGTPSYPGELSREEAERLSDSQCFCTSGLHDWPEWKPLLIHIHELDRLIDLSAKDEEVLRERGLYPRCFAVSSNGEDLVYSTFEVEVFRSLAPVYLPRLCGSEHVINY